MEMETWEQKQGKKKNCASYSTASRTSTVFYFVHSWLGLRCYMLGRGETEFFFYKVYAFAITNTKDTQIA